MTTLTLKKSTLGIGILMVLGVAWTLTAVSLAPSTFNILNVLRGGNMAAWSWAFGIAEGITAYVSSWWGFALAIAAGAAIGVSWLAVAIRALIQRVGVAFAIRWATFT